MPTHILVKYVGILVQQVLQGQASATSGSINQRCVALFRRSKKRLKSTENNMSTVRIKYQQLEKEEAEGMRRGIHTSIDDGSVVCAR